MGLYRLEVLKRSGDRHLPEAGSEWHSDGAGEAHLDEVLLESTGLNEIRFVSAGKNSLVHAFSRCGERETFELEDLFRADPDFEPNRGKSLGDMLIKLVRDESEDFLEIGRSLVEPLSLSVLALL